MVPQDITRSPSVSSFVQTLTRLLHGYSSAPKYLTSGGLVWTWATLFLLQSSSKKKKNQAMNWTIICEPKQKFLHPVKKHTHMCAHTQAHDLREQRQILLLQSATSWQYFLTSTLRVESSYSSWTSFPCYYSPMLISHPASSTIQLALDLFILCISTAFIPVKF